MYSCQCPFVDSLIWPVFLTLTNCFGLLWVMWLPRKRRWMFSLSFTFLIKETTTYIVFRQEAVTGGSGIRISNRSGGRWLIYLVTANCRLPKRPADLGFENLVAYGDQRPNLLDHRQVDRQWIVTPRNILWTSKGGRPLGLIQVDIQMMNLANKAGHELPWMILCEIRGRYADHYMERTWYDTNTELRKRIREDYPLPVRKQREH